MRRPTLPAAAIAVALTLASTGAAVQAQVPGLRGTLIVTNKTPSTATIIDVATGRTLATLPTGPGPHEIALSSTGRTAVVTDYGGPGARNTLTVIDVPSASVTRTISLGSYRAPHGIVYLPGDSLVAVTSEATGTVVIVHVAEGVVRRAVPTTQAGSHMVGVTADGATGYTGNMSAHTVSQLDLRAGAFVQTFAVPHTPEAINVTPDGREVWVGSNAQHRVSVLDPNTGAVTMVTDSVDWPYRVLFTPDVKTVLIPDMNRHQLRVIDRASRTELSRLTFDGGGPQGITLSPDGRYAFVSLSKQARVAVIDVRARAVAGYLPAGETPDGVVYSSAVYARSRGSRGQRR
jgi:DNA-binding beta-propeller fold protein YncE